MYDINKSVHEIKLVWSSRNRNDESRGYANETIKLPSQDLRTFIIEERKKNVEIFVDYVIDGVSFAFWVNVNLYKKYYIGESIRANMCYSFNHLTFKDIEAGNIDATYQKIILKKIIGQKVTLEDAYAYYKKWDCSEEEMKNNAIDLVLEENMNTMLYCSGCCGDRMCGYFDIEVYHKNGHIVWLVDTYAKIKIAFEKNQYLQAFEEYTQLVNHALKTKGEEIVDVFAKVEEKKMIEDLLEEGINEFKSVFTFNDALKLFKSGEVYKINLGFILSKHFEIDLSDFLDEIGLAHQGVFFKSKGLSWDKPDFLNMALDIELDNNEYTNVLVEIFQSVECHLYFGSSKHIPTFASMKWLRNVTELKIKCKITEVPPVVFELKDLEKLVLLKNEITHIPKDILKLKKLKHLNIEHNKITEFPEFIKEMNLETFLFKGNPFTENIDVDAR